MEAGPVCGMRLTPCTSSQPRRVLLQDLARISSYRLFVLLLSVALHSSQSGRLHHDVG